MDAQVVLLFQEKQNRIRDGPNAQLEGIPVPDQGGHVLADGPFHIGDLGGCQLNDGLVGLYDAVHPGHMEEAVSQGSRHLLIHLGNDQIRHFRSGLGVVHRDAQAAVAVLIRGRNLNQSHIGVKMIPQKGRDL